MVAQKERGLIILATLLSVIVVVPVFTLLGVIAWKYREGNTKAKYTPEADGNRVAETIWWLIPLLLIAVLSVINWQSSHELDPFRSLNTSAKSMTIQVVAMDWKWLFIYPDQHIASVNFVQFPKDTQLNFQITSDAPMNGFWIPQLGGQVYAMSGMSMQLHLMASKTGDFAGSSSNISGKGFAGMKFTARSSSQADFDSWVRSAKKSPNHLTLSAYNKLAAPSENNKTAVYSSAEHGLYDTIVMKYMMPGGIAQ
jgi:cytochrome o ubiquinol oxidase subunit 2